MAARNGMERWRGETTETLRTLKGDTQDLKEAIDKLGDRFEAALAKHVDEDRTDFATVNGKVDAAHEKVAAVAKAQAAMRGKVAGISALIGAGVAAILQVAAEKLLH